MLLALGAASIVLAVLLAQLGVPRLWRVTLAALRARRAESPPARYDPGRELRAEQRARELLRSCVNEEEWEMYRDLGFIRVWGSLAARPQHPTATAKSEIEDAAEADYAYLIYPHRPIVAYLPQTGRLLNEYCVAFPDETRPYGSPRLPASDDVLAKWMALGADERRLVEEANMHVPGRQVAPEMVARDLARLARWERERLGRERRRRATPSS